MHHRNAPHLDTSMPSLTVAGKRMIVKLALKNRGEKALSAWLKERNISSIRALDEKVRSYKAAFFRDLFAFGTTKEL